MSLIMEQATRQGMIPLIGVYGKSGSGKTHSALNLARGIAGPTKKIAIIDTERKRSGALVDLIPGGFLRINLEAPFTPESYSEGIKVMEDANVGCGVIDSLTHEWDGEGGILEMQEDELQRMAGDNYQKREACKMAAWIKPKQRHKLLIAAILRTNIPLICCLRADEKTHIDKVDSKTKVTTDDFTTPIYDRRFIFEMLVNLETVVRDGQPGHARVVKWTHPDLLKCLPDGEEQVGIKHGEQIARWCAAGSATTAPASKDGSLLKQLKKQLWDLTLKIHNGEARNLEQWMIDENIITDTQTIADLTVDELPAIIEKARAKLR